MKKLPSLLSCRLAVLLLAFMAFGSLLVGCENPASSEKEEKTWISWPTEFLGTWTKDSTTFTLRNSDTSGLGLLKSNIGEFHINRRDPAEENTYYLCYPASDHPEYIFTAKYHDYNDTLVIIFITDTEFGIPSETYTKVSP
jgi:hypothetical protein